MATGKLLDKHKNEVKENDWLLVDVPTQRNMQRELFHVKNIEYLSDLIFLITDNRSRTDLDLLKMVVVSHNCEIISEYQAMILLLEK